MFFAITYLLCFNTKLNIGKFLLINANILYYFPLIKKRYFFYKKNLNDIIGIYINVLDL